MAETLAWDYPRDRLDVLVASDASEDRTDVILQGISDPRLTFVRMEKRGGKNVALNRLVQSARGELLFFTDANAHIAPECLQRMVRHLADERVGCVTGMTASEQTPGDLAIGSGDHLYLRYETLIGRLENRIGSVLVCDGAIFCVRRSLFRPLLPELANDLELPLRIAHAGYWILHEPEARVFEKETPSPREEFARRRRICGQGMLGMWRLRETLAGLRGWQFASHKFLRWLTLVPLGLVLVSTIGLRSRPVFAALLVVQVIFYAAALAGFILTLASRGVSRLLSAPFYGLLGSLGALVGVIEACLGRRFAVWEIPTLSRGADATLRKAG